MANILIACNNDSEIELHSFFQTCADTARQYCVDNCHTYTSIQPPYLQEAAVIDSMQCHQLCFVAAHGDFDGIYNENEEDVITTRTTNYAFADKGIYTVACFCGQNLHPELHRLGLKLSVGYNAPFIVGDNEEAFCDCALEGLKHLLQGKTKVEAHNATLNKYDEVIATLPFTDKIRLLHNKECLVFRGEETVSLLDLV